MIYRKQAKAIVRRLIRKARKEGKRVDVLCSWELDYLHEHGANENELVEAVFGCDETTIRIVEKDWTAANPERVCGYIAIVLEYGRLPEEIISDYSANKYTEALVRHAEQIAA